MPGFGKISQTSGGNDFLDLLGSLISFLRAERHLSGDTSSGTISKVQSSPDPITKAAQMYKPQFTKFGTDDLWALVHRSLGEQIFSIPMGDS